MTKRVLWIICAIIFLILCGINIYAAFFAFKQFEPITIEPDVKPVEGIPEISLKWVNILNDNQRLLIQSYNDTIHNLNTQIDRFNNSWKTANILSAIGFFFAFITCIPGIKHP